MKVLFLTHTYPPSNAPGAQRTFFFGKYLQEESGIHAEVLTPSVTLTQAGESNWADRHNSHALVHLTGYPPFARSVAAAVVGKQADQPSERWRVRPTTILKTCLKTALFPDRAIPWLPYAVKSAKKLLGNDDEFKCIFSSSPHFSDHLAACQVAKKHDLRWIADFRDYHYIEVQDRKSGFLKRRLHKQLEKLVLKKATALTFISDAMLKEYAKHYPAVAEKGRAIYNGLDLEEFEYGVHTERGLTKPLVIFYCGNFYGGARSPRPLLDAIDHLLASGRIQNDDIRIDVAGMLDADSRRLLKQHRCHDMINILGVIPRKDVISRMTSSDALWLIVGNSKSHYHGFPVKGYEYIAARRPILAFCPQGSESHKILVDNSISTVFPADSNSLERVSSVLIDLMAKKSQGASFDLPVDKIAAKYTRRFQSRQLGELISSLCTECDA